MRVRTLTSGRSLRPGSNTRGYHEHRAVHRQRSEGQRRGAVHEGHPAVPAVRLLRPGGADPRLPRRAVQGPQRAGVRRAPRTASRPIPTGRPSRSSTSRASSSAAATSSARCSRRASCRADEGKGPRGEGRRDGLPPLRLPRKGGAGPRGRRWSFAVVPAARVAAVLPLALLLFGFRDSSSGTDRKACTPTVGLGRMDHDADRRASPPRSSDSCMRKRAPTLRRGA